MAFTQAMGFCRKRMSRVNNLQQQPRKNLLFPSYVVRASTAHKVPNASQLEINDIDDRCTTYHLPVVSIGNCAGSVGCSTMVLSQHTKYQVLPRGDLGDRNSRALSWLVFETCPTTRPATDLLHDKQVYQRFAILVSGVIRDRRCCSGLPCFDGRLCLLTPVP
jgi:hypothetical protein